MKTIKSIQELEKEPIRGNAYHDQHIFDGCHKIIMSSCPMDKKIQAYELIGKTMDLPDETVTEVQIAEYIKTCGD